MLLVPLLVMAAIGLAIHNGIRVRKEDEVRELFERIGIGMDLEEAENILGSGMEVIDIDVWGANVVWKRMGFELRFQVDPKGRISGKALRSPNDPRPKPGGLKSMARSSVRESRFIPLRK